VPGAEPAGDEGSKKNKKKRGKKGGQGQEGGQPEPSGGASLAPPREQNGANGNRSPERRGPNGRNPRSQSRNNQGRSRSNTQQGNRAPQQQTAPAPANDQVSQDPNAKKVRSLQKKIRAIEDLEMRLAGGEKLEDTQMKKINTKSSVIKELETLGAEA
jgi:translation initiation factor 2A